MSFPESAIDDRLVTDTEKAAFDVLPLLVGADDAGRNRYAVALADSMGNPGEFQRYVTATTAERLAHMDCLLNAFRENVELLVHKTWVEKTEEKPKERLLEDLLAFERDYRDGAVAPSFRRFVALARSIASLLFGAQSRAVDFLPYCFRIDPKLGLFFWFVGEIEKQARDESSPDEVMKIECLIGVYVLSSF
jgi:hypothetical protein